MLHDRLGPFPLFHFWGPFADIRSSRWIAQATRLVHQAHRPTLTLTYLPHLDYPLQKLGPDHPDIPAHVRLIDHVAADLVDYFRQQGVRPIVVSEYGIEPVDTVIRINRALRRAGLLAIRVECGGELLDFGECDAFAVADHQVAHVYLHPRLRQATERRAEVEQLCRDLPGVAAVHAIDHPRAGDLVLEAGPGAWFTYDYWLDDAQAPDFARTIDIHRKPGYDPRELFCDAGRLKLMRKMLAKRLGLRQVFDIVPLDPTRVRGSHGRTQLPADLQPIALGLDPAPADPPMPSTAIHQQILNAMFGE
jgi:predicted AlkP superfamily pyrophosphatase or phosphodiesterase